MKRFRDFFLFCSGVHVPMLKRAPSETNKYGGIGATIFFTGLLAAFSGGYALWTVFSSPWGAIAFGIVWGLMIFNLDRYIVSGMKKRNKAMQEFGMALPRLILAVFIAVVISKPLELKVFEKEINQELIVMEQQVFKTQEDRVQDRFQQQVVTLNTEIGLLNEGIRQQAAKHDTLKIIAQQEADGTGGSRRQNLGPIYKAKKADADSAGALLQRITVQNGALIAQKRQQLAAIDSTRKATVGSLDRSRIDGLASRLDALGHLTERSEHVRWANWFIMLLFVTIETAPVFVKLISPRGPYDDLLEAHEHAYIIFRKEQIEKREREYNKRMMIGQTAGVNA
ncbi:DUF4407 domain-containing protein [Chitinophaga rhizophila]|uniref:DUF4407 domain-containing protein n=1 Tax=Chitinophaga rhizophila TaxID=2866212 RepID=A0ABS7GBW7_9BACT|nr:DUF4407 domain-containing protein [Chitinophaga rhizophila]MBW8685165.1 DUF4407 domain-containing protein [Chitinophaga rhizophila]